MAFQCLEGAVNELLELMSGGVCEATRILANDLDYSKRLNVADVLFARFVDIRNNTDPAAKGEFHKLMVETPKPRRASELNGAFPITPLDGPARKRRSAPPEFKVAW